MIVPKINYELINSNYWMLYRIWEVNKIWLRTVLKKIMEFTSQYSKKKVSMATPQEAGGADGATSGGGAPSVGKRADRKRRREELYISWGTDKIKMAIILLKTNFPPFHYSIIPFPVFHF